MSTPARKHDPAEFLFLPGKAGSLLTLYRPPVTASKATLIIVPAFAEEMNKSRRMYTLLADALNQHGVGVLLPDLFGTGDSEGGFAEARWQTWLEDLGSILQWVRNKSDAPVSLLGHRLGALLALELAQQHPGSIEKIVLWQPVSKGSNYLTQFLRLRMAASMLDSGQEKETTQQLRDQLQQGRDVEVAGYLLHPQLAQAIDDRELVKLVQQDTPPLHWLELYSGENPALSPASRKNIAACEEKGIPVHSEAIRGDAFWSTVEIATVPALVDKTVEVFQ